MTDQRYDILHVYIEDERMDYDTIGPFDSEEDAREYFEKYINQRVTNHYGRLSEVFFIANVGEKPTSSPDKYIEDHELCEECGQWLHDCEHGDEDDE